MKRSRRPVSLLLAFCVILSSLAFSITAFGKIYELRLGVKTSVMLDGADDLAQFSFTPSASGIYTFLSYNTPASEAYLIVRETQPDGSRKQVQLAYSNNDPNYVENGHNELQFALTYHLDKGVTYYFWAGWYLSSTRTSGTTTVMLRCDRYDEESLESISVSCPVSLEAYTDGHWAYDLNDELYYYYNITRLLSNMTVTLHYSDGTTSSGVATGTIDGHTVSYTMTQNVDHWYANNTPQYRQNRLTISVLNCSCDYEVNIINVARYLVKGRVIDYVGHSVANAKITSSRKENLATTDSSGNFSYYTVPGESTVTISTPYSIDRKVKIIVSAINNSNDYTSKPIKICNCDYYKDGHINIKDYVAMRNVDGINVRNEARQFNYVMNMDKNSYEDITLS